MSNESRRIRKFWSLWVFLAVAGCTSHTVEDQDPKRRLQEYIDKSFNVTSEADRAQMLPYLTGEAKERLAAWSDEQFKDAFMVSKKHFIKLLILETKPINPTQTDITYELSYIDQGKGKDAKVTNKKLAQFVKQDNEWFIQNVRNEKELVEYTQELSLP